MSKKKKIGFWTIWDSHRHYLNEVSVEGKTTRRFQRILCFWERYHLQIIRTGNCITLLTTPFSVTEDSFWNINHFEDLAKYVFWTFNKSFLIKLIDRVDTQRPLVLLRCRELLLEHPVAYKDPPPANIDEELLFCYRKSAHMKKSSRFDSMYQLDEQNRGDFLKAIEKRIAELPSPQRNPADEVPNLTKARDPQRVDQAADFLEFLRPMDGSPDNTLQLIAGKVDERCPSKRRHRSILFSPN